MPPYPTNGPSAQSPSARTVSFVIIAAIMMTRPIRFQHTQATSTNNFSRRRSRSPASHSTARRSSTARCWSEMERSGIDRWYLAGGVNFGDASGGFATIRYRAPGTPRCQPPLASCPPLVRAHNHSASRVEPHPFGLQQRPLARRSESRQRSGVANYDLATRIDDAIPGQVSPVRKGMQRVANLAGLPGQARQTSHLSIRRHPAPGNSAHHGEDSSAGRRERWGNAPRGLSSPRGAGCRRLALGPPLHAPNRYHSGRFNPPGGSRVKPAPNRHAGCASVFRPAQKRCRSPLSGRSTANCSPIAT